MPHRNRNQQFAAVMSNMYCVVARTTIAWCRELWCRRRPPPQIHLYAVCRGVRLARLHTSVLISTVCQILNSGLREKVRLAVALVSIHVAPFEQAFGLKRLLGSLPLELNYKPKTRKNWRSVAKFIFCFSAPAFCGHIVSCLRFWAKRAALGEIGLVGQRFVWWTCSCFASKFCFARRWHAVTQMLFNR